MDDTWVMVVGGQQARLSVSSRIDGPHGIHDICLSLPSVVDANGVSSIVELGLSEAELVGLRRSADVLIAAREALGR